ncbi:OX-2 membrane glycoprotein-like [Oreochromis aureus]|uniref:OX-2 membrane glycoprotein-like n=1 Tax=Oreochromis aureus TaxID=47969 RepID=UPI001954FFC3|nr:OX-2 membrane glycoprotein-like [Oreochromis aureus]
MPQFRITHYVIAVFIFGVFDKVLTAVIQTQQTVLAAVGEDAEFSCQLLETKDVLQIQWNKLFHWKGAANQEKNIASLDKIFGQRVNPEFIHKIKFKHAGLQNTSIVIRNVTKQDESCYQCLFKTPEGSLTATTCLHLYDLYQPVLDDRESDYDDGLNEKSRSNHINLEIRTLVILSSVVLVACATAVIFVRTRDE